MPVSVRDRALQIVTRPRTVVVTRTEAERRIVVRAPQRAIVTAGAPRLIVRGIQGPTGAQGATGPAGPSGGASGSYTHVQSASAAVWTVVHNLGFRPGGITIEDTLGRDVEGAVAHLDANSLTVTFNAAFSGKAYVS